jgi:hypothetical protein
MPRTSVARQASALSMQDPWYPADLLPQIQSTLAALADIEVRYQSDQEQLQAWRHGSRCTREGCLDHPGTRHSRERQASSCSHG